LRRFAFSLAVALLPLATGGVITFDDLPLSSGGAPIPTSYAGLNWSDWGYTSAPFVPSGYATVLTSSPNVAFNMGADVPGNLAIISSPTPFTVLSGEFAAAFDNDLTITVTAELFGSPVGTVNFTVDETTRLLQTFNFGPVTELDFSVSGGTPAPGVDGEGPFFGLDNLTIAPEPPTPSLILVGFLGLAFLKLQPRSSI
jgi:hypothetical protein